MVSWCLPCKKADLCMKHRLEGKNLSLIPYKTLLRMIESQSWRLDKILCKLKKCINV